MQLPRWRAVHPLSDACVLGLVLSSGSLVAMGYRPWTLDGVLLRSRERYKPLEEPHPPCSWCFKTRSRRHWDRLLHCTTQYMSFFELNQL